MTLTNQAVIAVGIGRGAGESTLKRSKFPIFGFPGRADLALGRAKRRLSVVGYFGLK